MKPACTGLKSKFELRKWNNECRCTYCRMVKRTNSIAMQPGSVHERATGQAASFSCASISSSVKLECSSNSLTGCCDG